MFYLTVNLNTFRWGGEPGDYSVKSCHIYTKPDSNESFKSSKEEIINLTNLKNQSLSIENLDET